MKKTISQFNRLAMLFLSIVVLVACGGGGGGGDDGSDTTSGTSTSDASWTYMVYMGADNNLSNSGLVDLNEMESVGSDANVKIALQAEFSLNYGSFLSSNHPNYNGETLRFLVTKDNDTSDVNIEAGTSIGNKDMADPDTLRDFIIWATRTYPADHYVLVIWDHGAGWKESRLSMTNSKGAVQDETSGSFMTLPQLAQAVTDAGVDLDIINFDACLMGMYEVLYEFNELTDYMVFSEETEPGDGDPYDTILSALVASPSMSASTLATTIVNKYYESYSSGSNRTEGITKSAVDMSYVNDLHTQVVALADGIIDEYDSISSVLSSAQSESQAYSYEENHDLYDFASYLATNLSSGDTKTAAAAITTTVTSMVIANQKYGSAVDDSYGIAIYVPTNNQISSAGDDLTRYGQLACNSSRASTWLDAVNKMIGTSADTQLVSGGFAFYVGWGDTDADVDLYVWEPCESNCSDTIYAPWMGQTTPNGYFSADSIDSGYSEEYYVANNYVEAGDYDILINYYGNGSTDYANVSLWYLDPNNNVTEWQQIGSTMHMDLSNAYPYDTLYLNNDLNNYSDWQYPYYTTRELTDDNTIRLLSADRNITITINRKKAKPIVADEKR